MRALGTSPFKYSAFDPVSDIEVSKTVISWVIAAFCSNDGTLGGLNGGFSPERPRHDWKLGIVSSERGEGRGLEMELMTPQAYMRKPP